VTPARTYDEFARRGQCSIALHLRQVASGPVLRTTKDPARDRMQAKLKEVKQELRKRMHQPIPEQGRWLAQV
jgi:hypothetical protein